MSAKSLTTRTQYLTDTINNNPEEFKDLNVLTYSIDILNSNMLKKKNGYLKLTFRISNLHSNIITKTKNFAKELLVPIWPSINK